ncbi:MAG: glycerol-3-phosphate 1-O-acyltransferase PlsY [Candidatus Bruticola sp.]
MIWLLILLAFCYLLGSFPSGAVVARHFNISDLSSLGSGSVGTTNTYRVLGLRAALIVLCLDVFKGFLAVCLSYLVFLPGFMHPAIKLLFGVAAVAGHNWSVFLKFKGGKGVATTCGIFLALMPHAVGVAALMWLGVALLTRWASAASLSAAFAFPCIAYVYGASTFEVISAILMASIVFFQHRRNLKRLIDGQEERLNIKFF